MLRVCRQMQAFTSKDCSCACWPVSYRSVQLLMCCGSSLALQRPIVCHDAVHDLSVQQNQNLTLALTLLPRRSFFDPLL